MMRRPGRKGGVRRGDGVWKVKWGFEQDRWIRVFWGSFFGGGWRDDCMHWRFWLLAMGFFGRDAASLKLAIRRCEAGSPFSVGLQYISVSSKYLYQQ